MAWDLLGHYNKGKNKSAFKGLLLTHKLLTNF